MAIMFRAAIDRLTSSSFMLTAIKMVHTIMWAFFVACICAVWVFALRSKYVYALISIGIVFVEVIVLALNSMHCPLSPLAARYTVDRRANFDIYLPGWLAGNTKLIFGLLYAAGILVTFARWSRS